MIDNNDASGALADLPSFLKGAKLSSRDGPVEQTIQYVAKAVRLEKNWETIVRKTREALLRENAVELYLRFFDDLIGKISKSSAPDAKRFARMAETAAYRGFGMNNGHLHITPPSKGGTRYQVRKDTSAIETHLREHISAGTFLQVYEAKSTASWKGGEARIAGSDVSQHISHVPVPGRFFKWKAPFALSNAAGVLRTGRGAAPRFENLFNPKPDDELLRWMLLDPSYLDEMEDPDYRRCLSSAMDVGQYMFDLNFLLKNDRTAPDVIFRDGSLFPQDAYIENYARDDNLGEFVQKAMREFFGCLSYARTLSSVPLYCGVVKSVQIKAYSALMDWFIADRIDNDWNAGGYTLNDGAAMNILLSDPSYKMDSGSVIGTCLIRRSFFTRANLNRKIPRGENLKSFVGRFEEEHPNVNFDPFKSLCEIGNLQMFFLGHSASPQLRLPRYEFFHHSGMESPDCCARAILAALRQGGLSVDEDHSHMSDEPIAYLIPTVTFNSHQISKDVGKYIDRATGAKIMAKFKQAISI